MKGLHMVLRKNSSPAVLRKNSSPAKTNSFAKRDASSNQTIDEALFISLIHASETTHQLKQIHSQIIVQRLWQSSWLTTQLISSSLLLKSVDYALSVFRHSVQQNTFIFNALIRGLAENTRFESSISHFVTMLRMNIRPDRLTFPFVLKSTAALFISSFGRSLHAEIVKLGIEFDSFVRVSLVDMYVKIDLLEFALQLFDESTETMKLGSILLWNVLITGCCKVGDMHKASELFEAMPERNIASWNSLINGFMRNGDLERAINLFDRMEERNLISWTTMVTGFSQNGNHERALLVFFTMLERGVGPNDLTVVSALSACAKIGAVETGIRIHNHLLGNNFRFNKTVRNALVDMYSKCGNINFAKKVFDEMKEKDLLTWSIMIWGWAIHGCFDQSVLCFENMKSEGIKPDGVVFLAILTACSHSGQVNEGLNSFNSMKHEYSIEPTMKHYTLIVDLLGRAGRLDEAFSFIQNMPINPDFVIWGALFCACKAHKNIKMAELVSDRLLQLEPKHTGSFVFLSNVYAKVGRWEDVERVRYSMKNRGLAKNPGWSYIELEGQVYSFVANDHSHERTNEIYLKLGEIAKEAREKGYVCGTEWVFHNIEEEEKEGALGGHSEKLALAFGLISTAPKITLRIVKNLRVCGDCHSLMKYVSKMSQREIVLRDIKRFHHFKDGACSCKDYW